MWNDVRRAGLVSPGRVVHRDDAALERGIGKDVTFPRGPQQTVTMTAEAYLTRFAVPNFYFHATTAYAILRENGFDIGKRDFLADVFEA